jgi:Cd2+/Zn2+-exporting ATPase
MGDKKIEIILNGLNCAHCAEVINQKVKELDDIENGDLNFINKKLTIIIKKDRQEENVIKTVVDIINNTEPGLNINILKNNKEDKSALGEINKTLKKVRTPYRFQKK